MKSYSYALCALMTAGLLFAGGCKKDSTTSPGVDTQAPVVSFSSPQAGAPVGRTTVQAVVDATDNVGVVKVEFYLDGATAPFQSVTAAPWSATVALGSLTDGNHTLLAKAYDAAGNVGSSTPLTFIRGMMAIVYPTTNQLVGPAEMYASVVLASGFTPATINLSVDGAIAPVAVITGSPYETVVPIAQLTDGNHTITASATNGGGTETTPGVAFTKGVTRMTLFEDVTSATCVPCGFQNAIFHDATSDLRTQVNLAVVKYHIWLPTPFDSIWINSKPWAQPRADYLFKPLAEKDFSSPNAWISGSAAGSAASDWIPLVQHDMTLAPDAKILIDKIDAGNTVNLTIKVTGINTSAYSDLRLHTIVTESNIQYHATNSEYVHHDAMRIMLPDANGEIVSIANNQTSTFQRTVTIDPRWVKANLKVIVVLQSDGSKKVLQAAKISLK